VDVIAVKRKEGESVKRISDVDEVIESSLREARSAIREGRTWEPQLYCVHSLGVKFIPIRTLPPGLIQKVRAIDQAKPEWSAVRGGLMITVAEVWSGDDTPDGFATFSWDIPLSDRKALLVEVKAFRDRVYYGIQKYSRCACGQVCFDEVCWVGPLA
jgi:hypothetical protein